MRVDNPSQSIQRTGLEIAIIGQSGRFPGAQNVAQFWQNLCNGAESISHFSEEELLARGVQSTVLSNPKYVRSRGVVDGIDLFDAAFFGMSPREAAILDPQQRLFLECCWEAFEDAGYRVDAHGSQTGVYAGAGLSSYYLVNLYPNRELHQSVGALMVTLANEKDHLTTRVSYKLNLQGPSVCVQSACSTSLVAVHLACQGLLSGECYMALAGGVNLTIPQKRGYLYEEGGILSPDGHCRAFDAQAQGTVGGEGVGVVLLKRLEDALSDGDYIRAIIKGSAINNDGSLKVGYTAPSVARQANVIWAAQRMAEIEPESITYVETHGTGTPLGDPIEFAALKEVFSSAANHRRFCALGSVKTNIGHLDTAAGVTGLIKTALALEHKLIPPSLHFERPNPSIDFVNSPFYLNKSLTEWQAGPTPRRAGVSSFGLGGTNSHVVLEEAPPRSPSGPSRPWQALTLSAKTPSALEMAKRRLAEHLNRHPELSPADVAYTLAVGRCHFEHRSLILGRDLSELSGALYSQDPTRVLTSNQAVTQNQVAFLFPGQGSKLHTLNLEFYQSEPIFRKYIDQCADLLGYELGIDLRELLFPDGEKKQTECRNLLSDTAYAQPVLFSLEYALAKMWMEWGITPRAMIGHSLGEFVAACLSDVFSLEDALRLCVARGRLMSRVGGGAMLAVFLPASDLPGVLSDKVTLAANNGPSQCVLSGEEEEVTAWQQQLQSLNVACRRLEVTCAFHSKMMDPVLEEWRSQVSQVKLSPPKIPYISNVTGDWITATEVIKADYWVNHLRHTVRFYEGAMVLLNHHKGIFLEVGPDNTLSQLIRRTGRQGQEAMVLPSLFQSKEYEPLSLSLTRSLGQLWVSGVEIDWQKVYALENRQRLPLPTYQFERQSYWVDPPKYEPTAQKHNVQDRSHIVSLLQEACAPVWIESMDTLAPNYDQQRRCWLIFRDQAGVSSALMKRWEEAGDIVISVDPGDRFDRLTGRSYTVDPFSPESYRELAKALSEEGTLPTHICHLWLVTPPDITSYRDSQCQREQQLAFTGIISVVQAFNPYVTDSKVEFIVVADGLQVISDEANVMPEKGATLGLIDYLSPNYERFLWRTVDIESIQEDCSVNDQLISALWTEFNSPLQHPVVALRGKSRWRPILESLAHIGEIDRKIELKKQGVYILAGEVNHLSTELAKYLGTRYQCKVALLNSHDKSGEPRSGNVTPGINLDMTEEVARINSLEENISDNLQIKAISKFPQLKERLDELSTSYIIDYLSRNHIEVKTGQTYKLEELQSILRIAPKFSKFFAYMIKALCEDGIALLDDGRLEFRKRLEELPKPGPMKQELEALYPDFSGLIGLLDHCAMNYDKALSGDVEAIGILYPDGKPDLLDQSFSNTIPYSCGAVYIRLLREVISQVLLQGSKEKLRFMEVGAGLGTLTKAIAPVLHGKVLEYSFTDLGKSFLIRAERDAKRYGLDWMKFGLFDISQPAEPQGYTLGTYDVILGFNVIHATPRISETIGNLKQLLTPNGILCLIEAVEAHRIDNLIWGLAEGWWYFDDTPLRQDIPLLDLDAWENVMSAQGFGSVIAYPRSRELRAERDYGLIIAQAGVGLQGGFNGKPSSGFETIVRNGLTFSELAETIKNAGGDLLTMDVPLSDSLQLEDALTSVRRSFGKVDGIIQIMTSAGTAQLRVDDTEAITNEVRSRMVEIKNLWEAFGEEDLDFLALGLLSDHTAREGRLVESSIKAFAESFVKCRKTARAKRNISIYWGGWNGREDSDADSDLSANFERSNGIEKGKAEIFFDLLTRTPSEVLRVKTNADGIPSTEGKIAVRSLDVDSPPPPDQKARHTYAISKNGRHPRPVLKVEYQASRNEVEQQLAAIWQDLFEIDLLGVHDSFYDLGGDSLLALQLGSKIRAIFGVDMNVRSLVSATTIAEMALLIGRERDDSVSSGEDGESLPTTYPILLRPGTSPRSLFLIHPGGGGIWRYRALAELLDTSISVYGIQAQGLNEEERPLTKIEEMAEQYLRGVLSIQGDGPYLLAGASFGGAVSLEMAQQLSAKGKECRLVALIDTPGPEQIGDELTADMTYFKAMTEDGNEFSAEYLHRIGLDGRLMRVIDSTKAPDRSLPNMNLTQSRRLADIWRANAEALRSYAPKPYHGRLTFFRALERSEGLPDNPELPWIEIAAGGIEIHIVPGNHENMLEEPHVLTLAGKLNQCFL